MLESLFSNFLGERNWRFGLRRESLSSFQPSTRTRHEMSWWKKTYRGAAFEHRIQASVGLSIIICAVVIPLSIMRIKQLKNREAPTQPDGTGARIANAISAKLQSRHRDKLNDRLELQALKVDKVK